MICFLYIKLPLGRHAIVNTCCMKRLCKGCILVTHQRGMVCCPFCRSPRPADDASQLAMVQKRVEKKDAEAINFLARKYFHEAWIGKGFTSSDRIVDGGC